MTHLQNECNSNTLQEVFGGKTEGRGSIPIPEVLHGFIWHWFDNYEIYLLVISKQLEFQMRKQTLWHL